MKNIMTRAAALFLLVACVFTFAACTKDGNIDKDGDGIIGEEGNGGTDNIIGDGGTDDPAKNNGDATDGGDMTNGLGDMTDDIGDGNITDDFGDGDMTDDFGGVLDPDDDVNGGDMNGAPDGGTGNSVDPELGIGTDGTGSANGSR